MSPRTTVQVLAEQERQAAAHREKGAAMSNTKLDVPFDVDVEEGSTFDLLPDGRYRAEISAAKCGPTGNGRGLIVFITWQIAEGEYERRTVYQNILIEHESQMAQKIGRGKFKDVCACCGITGQVADLEVLLFKPCVITVRTEKDRNGDYPDKNKVVRVDPVGVMASPEQLRQKQHADAVREACKVEPAFESTDEKLNDPIPF
jgi:hypothetical protein